MDRVPTDVLGTMLIRCGAHAPIATSSCRAVRDAWKRPSVRAAWLVESCSGRPQRALLRACEHDAASLLAPLRDVGGAVIGGRALMTAVERGHVRTVSAIVRANPRCGKTSSACLLATKLGYADVLREIVSHARVTASRARVTTIVWAAVRSDRGGCLSVLLDDAFFAQAATPIMLKHSSSSYVHKTMLERFAAKRPSGDARAVEWISESCKLVRSRFADVAGDRLTQHDVALLGMLSGLGGGMSSGEADVFARQASREGNTYALRLALSRGADPAPLVGAVVALGVVDALDALVDAGVRLDVAPPINVRVLRVDNARTFRRALELGARFCASDGISDNRHEWGLALCSAYARGGVELAELVDRIACHRDVHRALLATQVASAGDVAGIAFVFSSERHARSKDAVAHEAYRAAIDAGKTAVVEWMISSGLPLPEEALAIACYKDDVDVIDALLRGGALVTRGVVNVAKTSSFYRPTSARVVAKLTSFPGSWTPDGRDEAHRAMASALQHDDEATVAAWIEFLGTVDGVLEAVARRRMPQLTLRLVGADAGKAETAFVCAAGAAETATVRLLMEAHPSLASAPVASKALTQAVYCGRSDLVSLLMDVAHVGPSDADLECAARRGWEDVLRLLLERHDGHADLDALLYASCAAGNSDVSQMLIDFGAAATLPQRAQRAFAAAAKAGDAKTMARLAERGVVPTRSLLCEAEVLYLLSAAAAEGDFHMVRELLACCRSPRRVSRKTLASVLRTTPDNCSYLSTMVDLFVAAGTSVKRLLRRAVGQSDYALMTVLSRRDECGVSRDAQMLLRVAISRRNLRTVEWLKSKGAVDDPEVARAVFARAARAGHDNMIDALMQGPPFARAARV
jgi:nucleotide-binding universal stress UspA family protein